MKGLDELLYEFKLWREGRALGLFTAAAIVIALLACVGLYHTGKFILGVIVWATWCGLTC